MLVHRIHVWRAFCVEKHRHHPHMGLVLTMTATACAGMYTTHQQSTQCTVKRYEKTWTNTHTRIHTYRRVHTYACKLTSGHVPRPAKCRPVHPRSSDTSAAAPAASKSRTMSRSPFSAASNLHHERMQTQITSNTRSQMESPDTRIHTHTQSYMDRNEVCAGAQIDNSTSVDSPQ